MSEEKDDKAKQAEQDVLDRQRVERSDPENRQGRNVKVDMSEDAYRERLQRERDGVASDEDRRLIRLHRKNRSEEYDRRADEERAGQEKRDGEAEGARGRNAGTVVITGEPEGGATSAGTSTDKSSDETGSTGSESKPDRPSTAPTTAPFSSRTPTDSSGARSTGGSGTANR